MYYNYNNFLNDKINCHKATEIVDNFFLCGKFQVIPFLENRKDFDVLIPLDSLESDIWNYIDPYKTSIFYFPCPDYSVLSQSNLNFLVNEILKFLKQKKKILLFCMGGHGRTGYIASCVLGKLSIDNPIKYIREHYCKSAIETVSQIISIGEYLGVEFTEELNEAKEELYRENLIANISKKINQIYIKNHKNKKETLKLPSVDWLQELDTETLEIYSEYYKENKKDLK